MKKSSQRKSWYVYAGFSEQLNRESLDRDFGIYVIKIGITSELETDAHIAAWHTRMNRGFVDRETNRPKSVSLAGCTDWEIIASKFIGDYKRAYNKIEQYVKDWINKESNISSSRNTKIFHYALDKMIKLHKESIPDIKFNNNGLSEICIFGKDNVDVFVEGLYSGTNDPLAREFIIDLRKYLDSRLSDLAFQISTKLNQG